MSADLTITHAHRTLMRRLARGEKAGDLASLLADLYLSELVDDANGPCLTEVGHALLRAHDARVRDVYTGGIPCSA